MSETIVEILCIGREILDGRVIDTHSVRIAQAISRFGLRPQYAQKVDDESGRVLEAFQIAKSRSKLIFVTGGLGPTSDDRTLELFAKFAGRKFIEYPEARRHLEEFLALRKRPVNSAQLKQIFYPEGGEILANPNGTACGFTIDDGDARWFFLPGPPREMQPMLESQVLPRLGGKKSANLYWITEFTPEAKLQEMLESLITSLPKDWDLSYQARFPEVVIGLHASDDSTQFKAESQEIDKILSGLYWYRGADSRRQMEEDLVDALRQSNSHIVSVESCTGGLIAERLTRVPGSSDAFLASWVTYANEAKVALGVNKETLDKVGAVAESTAREMAESGLKSTTTLASTQRLLSVATTGIAGPGGGSSEKPVGLCFIALADSQGKTITERIEASPYLDRQSLRHYFSQKAMGMTLRRLRGEI